MEVKLISFTPDPELLAAAAARLCYRDVSFGNVFFDPGNGDVLICDNDNVGVDNGTGRVLGTPFFMAPEVVRDLSYRTLPNTDTDRHSLAVLLFYILCVGHPLEGRRTERGLRDATWLLTHFGTDPLFCLHPDNDENRPVSTVVEKYWEIYPAFFRRLFVQAFVDGLYDPNRRVTESEWIKAFDRLRDGMVQCGNCQATNFWDRAEPDRPCSGCGGSTKPAFVLRIGRRQVATSPFASIRADHLRSGTDESSAVGQVRRHPQDPSRWGLHNLSDRPWTATFATGQQFRIEPDNTIELADGLRVDVADAVVFVTSP